MAGTILKTLLSTHQADNTAMNAANSGFTSGSAGSGNTAIHLDAAKMGASEGYRFTQGGANQNNWYLDLDSPVNILALRVPFNYPTAVNSTPGSAAILRGYPDTSHAATMWTLALTSANRLNFVEAGTGGLQLTSASGTPLVPGSDYVLLMEINTSTMAFSLVVFARGSSTALFTLSGTLVTSVAQQSVRFGIGTGSALAQINTNDTFAAGSGDRLLRADITNPPLTLSASLTPSTGPNPTSVALTLTPSGGNGNAISYSVDWGDGTTSGPQSSPNFTHNYTRPVGVTNGVASATQAN